MFSILFMRSENRMAGQRDAGDRRRQNRQDEATQRQTQSMAPPGVAASTSPLLSDLTARARIRDAAIRCFAREGFRVPVRAIATEAGVSPGLVIHHYGSKEGLRQACDEHVRTIIAEAKTTGVAGSSEQNTGFFMQSMANLSVYHEPFRYMLRTLEAGGQLARDFIDSFTQAMAQALEAGVAAGSVKPSIDPQARVRLLTYMAAGSLVLAQSTGELGDVNDPDFMDTYMEHFGLPLIELYTHGLTTDSSIFDTYIAKQRAKPPRTVTRHKADNIFENNISD